MSIFYRIRRHFDFPLLCVCACWGEGDKLCSLLSHPSLIGVQNAGKVVGQNEKIQVCVAFLHVSHTGKCKHFYCQNETLTVLFRTTLKTNLRGWLIEFRLPSKAFNQFPSQFCLTPQRFTNKVSLGGFQFSQIGGSSSESLCFKTLCCTLTQFFKLQLHNVAIVN